MLSPFIDRATSEVLGGTDHAAVAELREVLRRLGFVAEEFRPRQPLGARTPIRKQYAAPIRKRQTYRPRYRGTRTPARAAAGAEETLRIARIVDHALRVFGSQPKAIAWLRQSNDTLAGFRPVDLLKTETGAQAVEASLHRIDFGIYA